MLDIESKVQESGSIRRNLIAGTQEASEEVLGAAGDDVADRAVGRAAGRDPEPARVVHHIDDVLQLAGGDSPSLPGMIGVSLIGLLNLNSN